MQRQFLLRVLSGLVAAPLVVTAVWQGGLWFALLLGAASAAGTWELYRMARAGGVTPIAWLGIPLAFIVPFLVHGTVQGSFYVPPSAAIVGPLAVLVVTLLTRSTQERPLAVAAVTVLAVLYTAGTVAFAYAMRYHPYAIGDAAATALVVLPVWLTWSTDTGAYLFGRIVGGPKLMPSVSPGKTVAGAVGGLLVAIGMGFAYLHYVLAPLAELSMTTGGTILFAVLVSVAAQLGDLVESQLKREAGVKDASGLFPGHGGILDRFDSIFFVMPVTYLVLPWFLIPMPLGSP